MNYWQRYTFPLFESICVRKGKLLRVEAHRGRFLRSYASFYGTEAPYDLFDGISIPPGIKGDHKLRISYGRKTTRYTLRPYAKRTIQRLQLVNDDTITYDLKFNNRNSLNRLLKKKGVCDDILISREGKVTDTSYSNIAFVYCGRWFTPSHPLLEGTHREVLLKENRLESCPIRVSEIPDFEGFQLINSMLEFQPDFMIPITHIQL